MTFAEDEIYTLVNIFTPKSGATDRFLDLQLRETAKMRADASATGWLNNEVYRARDGARLVVVTRFASAGAQEAWAATPAFAEHLDRIGPLLESVESIPVTEVARHAGAENGAGARSRLVVITGSTREGRFADKPADWIARKAASRGDFDVEAIDLREVPLPFLGDPRATEKQKAAAAGFAERIAGFDAYVLTVAEYNHGPTAVLKNALDHAEWKRKPAGLVGYGGAGGARAVEHIRAIAAELEMVTIQTGVHVSMANYLAISRGDVRFDELEHLESAADKMLGQLAWWTRALKTARSETEAIRVAAMMEAV